MKTICSTVFCAFLLVAAGCTGSPEPAAPVAPAAPEAPAAPVVGDSLSAEDLSILLAPDEPEAPPAPPVTPSNYKAALESLEAED